MIILLAIVLAITNRILNLYKGFIRPCRMAVNDHPPESEERLRLDHASSDGVDFEEMTEYGSGASIQGFPCMGTLDVRPLQNNCSRDLLVIEPSTTIGEEPQDTIQYSTESCYKRLELVSSHKCHKIHSHKTNHKTLRKSHSCYNTAFSSVLERVSHSTFVVFCLLFLHITVVAGQNPTWREPPRNSSNRLSETVTFKCGVDNLGDRKIIWKMYSQADVTILFIDDEYFADINWPSKDRYSVAPHPIRNTNGYDLTIRNIERSDDTSFECSVQNVDLKQKVWLVVLVPPSNPAISTNKTLTDLLEGDVVAFTCTSDGGNPPPYIHWYRNNEPLASITTPPSAKFGTTTGVVVRELTYEDDGAVMKCEAENDAGSAPPNSRTLSVRFSPKITFTTSPLVVVEGRLARLTCGVTANPTVQQTDVRWLRAGSPVDVGFVHEITSTKTSDAGVYTCEATNVIATETKDLTLDVQYGPRVTMWTSQPAVGDRVELEENRSINLTCLVTANPAVPPRDVRWTRDGVLVATGLSYVIQTVQRSHTGNYTCTADNTLTPSGGASEKHTGTAQIRLLVRYKPGPASMAVPSSIIKGESATLTCVVFDPGYPAADLVWTKTGQPGELHRGSSYFIQDVRLEDTGLYTCTPENSIGKGQADSENVVVNERVGFIAPSLPTKQTVSVNETGVVAHCAARGKPSPVITWYKNGERLEVPSSLFTVDERKTTIDTHSWNVTQTLKLQGSGRAPLPDSLTPDDRGNYTCHVTNSISTGITATLNLVVMYSPIVNTPSDKVAIDANQSAVLICRAHAYPTPSFRWYNGSSELIPSGRVDITYTEDSSSEFQWQTTLVISDVQQSDLGNYTCETFNVFGRKYASVELTVKTFPDAPSSLQLLSKTWESVELTWAAGFNGGYAQHFVIHYRDSVHGDQQQDAATNTRFNVTGLYPFSNYTFNVRAENILGTSDASNSILTTTDAFTIEPPTNVVYNTDTKTLVFESPSSHYCARIDIYDGSKWHLYEPCAPTEGGSILIDDDQEVSELTVALCLTRRVDVCSANTTAVIENPDDLPASTIIIVACVCGVVVIALTIVLIVLCCRRKQSRRKFEEDQQKRTQPSSQQQPHANGGLKSAIKGSGGAGYENPAVDGNTIDFDDGSNTGVFATNTSQNAGHYDPYAQHRHLNGNHHGHHNGHVGNGYIPRGNEPPPAYDSQFDNPYVPVNKKKLPEKTYLSDDPYIPKHETSKESHSSDSGVSTPDPVSTKKKVIHEVIV